MNEFNDEFNIDTEELLLCSQFNFENIERLFPGCAVNPIWVLAKKQLAAVIDRLEEDYNE